MMPFVDWLSRPKQKEFIDVLMSFFYILSRKLLHLECFWSFLYFQQTEPDKVLIYVWFVMFYHVICELSVRESNSNTVL